MTRKKRLPLAILEKRRKIGEFIKESRKTIGFSRRKISLMLGCSAVYLQAVERGNARLAAQFQPSLAAILDVNLDDIREGICNELPKKEIGKIIRSRRLALGMTQDDLSFKVKSSAAKISKIECGKMGVSLSNIHKWVKVLTLPKHCLRPDYFRKDEH